MCRAFALLFITGLILIAAWCDVKQRYKDFMARFRKKQLTIDAMQFDGKNASEIYRWASDLIGPDADVPIVEPIGSPLVIKTLEGDKAAMPGDFIICDDHKQLFVRGPEIFTKTYEAVNSPEV